MTFLRWAGSKRQLLDVLSSCWHASFVSPGTRYIEGFSGSASLFFHLRPASALLVDVNQELQHCLRRVQISPKGVSAALNKFQCSEEEYYRVRAENKASLSPNQRAANFIYLNRYCFNGLYRTNAKGEFNVPFGGPRAGSLPSYLQLLDASKALKNAELVTGDFYDSIAPRIQKNDFIYLDPPYAKRNAGLDNQYGPDVFGTQDIHRLDLLLTKIDKCGARFLVSYANCDEINHVAQKWHTHVVSVRRTIAANAAKRGIAQEILITNL